MVGVCMFIKAVNDGLSNTIWDDRGHWIAQIRGFSGPLSWSAVQSFSLAFILISLPQLTITEEDERCTHCGSVAR